MTIKNDHNGTPEGLLNDPTLIRRARMRRSEMFFKRFRQKAKDHKRYGKSDRALNHVKDYHGSQRR